MIFSRLNPARQRSRWSSGRAAPRPGGRQCAIGAPDPTATSPSTWRPTRAWTSRASSGLGGAVMRPWSQRRATPPGDDRRRAVGGGGADRRAVDDQHRHGGRSARPPARWRSWRARAPSWCALRSTRRRPRRRSQRIRATARMPWHVSVPLIGDFHLQRPPPADPVPGLRPGAGQVPHQPGQRRARREARRAVRHHDRDGVPLRQAGAHRRELGQPRPGAAGAHDGRECAAPAAR